MAELVADPPGGRIGGQPPLSTQLLEARAQEGGMCGSTGQGSVGTCE